MPARGDAVGQGGPARPQGIVKVEESRSRGAGGRAGGRSSSGVLGDSGARATGGLPTDPGSPMTHSDIVEGRIPAKNGSMAPAVQIR